ncbi:MAG: SDR family oxidoreductase [Nocardioidaceae bacterium]
MPIGVTGSSGNLGGRIARLLASEGVDQRLLLRSPAKAPDLPRAEVAQASYDDGAAVRRALSGVEVALMVSGSESANRLDQHRSFVDAAAEAGVRHLVYTSFYGAAADSTFTLARDHHHTERYIEDSGMTWTFLRDNLYLDFFPLLAGEDGVLRGPANGGRVAAVAQDDIAAVATTVLLDPSSHERRTYDLTGPEALTLAEAAATLSQVLGREYSFHDESLEEAYASRASYGAPDWQVDAWVSTYTAIASGELSRVTGDVERVTGRAPLSLADVLGDRA